MNFTYFLFYNSFIYRMYCTACYSE